MASQPDSTLENPTDGPQLHGAAQRRLAINACVSCRQRKTKCDEARPACERCSRLRLSCTYREAPSPREAVLATVLDQRLQRVEAKLDLLCQSALQRQSNSGLGTHDSAGQVSTLSPESSYQYGRPHTTATVPGNRISTLYNNDADLAIPQRHSTAPQNMLLWSCAGGRFGDSELLYPLVLETARPSPPRTAVSPKVLSTNQSNWLECLTLTHFNCLTASYFQHFHPRNMILDEREFYSHEAPQTLRNGFDRSTHSCIVLLVLAIGSISAVEDGFTEWGPADTEPSTTTLADQVGAGFFAVASSIFSDACDNGWSSVRCWLLIAFYHSLKLQVYDQWQAISRAAMTTMLLLRMDVGSKQIQSQLFWVIYLQESQLLAELDFPSSGITRLENIVALPFAQDQDVEDEPRREHRLIFLAEISLRRMLNRVHFHIYDCFQPQDVGTATSPARFASQARTIISELDSQLESWRGHLPPTLTADFENGDGIEAMAIGRTRPVREKMIGTLKARYFAAKAILFRPFVYRVLHAVDPESLSHEEISGAVIALESALQIPLCSGLLCDNLRLVPLLINPARSFFALAILVKFMSGSNYCLSLLPPLWEKVAAIRARLDGEVAARSPLIRRDLEILSLLDELDHSA